MSVYDQQELRKRFSLLFAPKSGLNFESEIERQIAIGSAADLALSLIYEAEEEDETWREQIEGMGFVTAAGAFISCLLILMATGLLGVSVYIWKVILG